MLIKFCKCWKKKNWRHDEEGSTAIEFGMLATPFIFLIVGILETTLFFAAGTILEGSAHHAARLIRTGQAQQAGDPFQAFMDQLCDYDSALLSCDDIDFEVIAVAGNTFEDAEATEPVFDGDGNLVSSGFDPGGPDDVVLIRLALRYDFKTPMLGPVMGGDTPDNSAYLLSTVVIRNEPYDFEDPTS